MLPCVQGNLNKALKAGEQFELLFTADKVNAKKILAKAKKHNIKISAIGEIVNKHIGKIYLVDKRGGRKQVKPEGYRHF